MKVSLNRVEVQQPVQNLPRNGADFITEYTNAVDLGEGDSRFHMWCAVSAIAEALGRKCVLDHHGAEYYANQYLMFIGASRSGKSTAMEQMEDGLFLPTLWQDDDYRYDHVYYSDTTYESLLENLAKAAKGGAGSSGYLFYDEFSKAFPRAENTQPYISGLTSLWDCRGEYTKRTKTQGVNRLEDIFINMIGASTLQWFTHAITESPENNGGFLPRVIFCWGRKKPNVTVAGKYRRAWDEPEMIRLQKELEVIARMLGKFKFSNTADAWFEKWYNEKAESAMMGDPILGTYFSSIIRTLVKKLSIITAVSEDCTYVIEKRHIERAFRMLESTFDDTRQVYTRMGKMSVENRAALSISAMLHENPKVWYSERILYDKFGQSCRGMKDFSSVLQIVEMQTPFLEKELQSGQAAVGLGAHTNVPHYRVSQ